MTAIITTVGARGIDANTRIQARVATSLLDHGYQFVIRYVPRIVHHANDITMEEAALIRAVGLGLMIVQHCEAGAWTPSAEKGAAYGEKAAKECQAIGYAKGCSVWLDLEEVAEGTPTADITAYCNRWYDAVHAAGYLPGVYVGWNARLSPHELYWRLKFKAYWAGYNLDRDMYPAVRGVQMLQREVRSGDVPRGIGIAFDVDIVSGDELGGFPVMDC